MTKRPLAIELFAGLHGWGAGLAAAGFRVVGFDIADMPRLLNHPVPEHCSLVLQDVRTLHGSQFRDAHLIVASPPCQEFSYMAMPFSRGKRIATALRGEGDFPEGYRGSRTIPELRALFDACFRLQREASEAAGRHIPLVVENVRGAQPWVGRAAWNYGSYYLWGDIPALMPTTLVLPQKRNPDGTEHGPGSWFAIADSKNRGALKVPGMNYAKTGKPGRSFQGAAVATFGRRDSEGLKQGGNWWHDPKSITRRHSSNSPARRAASALIAKIPFALAEHIGRVYYPHAEEQVA